MRKIILLAILLLHCVFLPAQSLNLVPRPAELTTGNGIYQLKDKMTVSTVFPDQDWKRLFLYLQKELKKQCGITLTETAKGQKGDIDFFMKRMPSSGGLAYTLDVGEKGISINANFDESAFYAIQTLLQLMPADNKAKKEIQRLHIYDHPRFDYRGMHLDVGRHFFPVSFIKRYIDYLAYHKLNRFHWHLTEDQGWRIEIRKYPELTRTGAWRNGTITGRYPGRGSDNMPHGGFYTQEEIKEVVRYAGERFVEVIPEIEMPGHSSAAIASYPWLSCFPEKPTAIPANMISKKSQDQQKNGRVKLVQETWGVFDDVFCAGKDSTFAFLQDVIDEVTALFPSRYFHIGGDECPKTHWKQCARCQQRMKDNGLKDEHELQSYFVQRIEKYLNGKGKVLIGWDEILEGGLAPNAVVMSWRGENGGIEAAKQKHQVIMTPGNPVYFDHSQSENEDSVTIGGYNPLDKVYAYEPIPAALNEEQAKNVMGAQANVWTEYMDNPRKVEYMIFPRMAALSEVLWSPKQGRNWEDFLKRLPYQLLRYRSWNAGFSLAYLEPKISVAPAPDFKGVRWVIQTRGQGSVLVAEAKKQKTAEKAHAYTEGGELVTHSCTMKANYHTQINDHTIVHFEQRFHFNKATGRPVTLAVPPSKSYPGDGAFTLVNGVINEKAMAKSREFLGFSGDNCEAVIDLGELKEISFVTVNALHQPGSWIWRPLSAEVFISGDGQNWHSKKLTDDFVENPEKSGKGRMSMAFKATFARYVKVVISNWGDIPAGSPGAGNKAWLFVDEVEVE